MAHVLITGSSDGLGLMAGRLLIGQGHTVTLHARNDERATTMPAVELATIVHSGPHDEIDRAYGTLAAHVAEHELAVEGPLREYYLVGPGDISDEAAWQTEIGWPVFATGTTG